MALAKAAEKVAAEFDFTSDQVRNAVKEFLREMGRSYLRDVYTIVANLDG
jgi:hypothetical protein